MQLSRSNRPHQVTDQTLLNLATADAEQPALTELDVSGCRKMTDAAMKHAGGMQALVTLHVSDCGSITDAGAYYPRTVPRLKCDQQVG